MAVQSTPTHCPICGRSEAIAPSRIFPKLFACSSCGGHFAVLGDAPEYTTEYFEESAPAGISRWLGILLRVFLYLRYGKVKRTVRGIPQPRILDYGCGSGGFVAFARARGLEVVGYEPSADAVRLAIDRGLPVGTTIPSGPFHLIMFWHSLEHTDRPQEVLEKVRGLLVPGGKILIAVPNAASWEARLAGERWFHYDYPFHRIQFTPGALAQMLERGGFRVTSFDLFNPEYTVSGLVQTLLNFFFSKDALYIVVSHRRANMPQRQAMFSAMAGLLFLVAFSPLIGAFFILELIFQKTGAIIVTAERL